MNAVTRIFAQSAAIKRDKIPLDKLGALAADFIDGTPESYKTLYKIYPDHTYDRLRRKIATELAGKEIAKILDAKDNEELESLRSSVNGLYDGREGVYASVHDFWSFVEMVLHIKKKELPELITAQNVDWAKEELPIEQLQITWMPFLEQQPEIFGEKPWHIADLQKLFFQKPELFERAKNEQFKSAGESQHKFDQSDEPISILYRHRNMELIDGNGRLYRALLHGIPKISCYIGRLKDAMPVNYWVSAGALKQFCLEIRGYSDVDLEGFANGLSYLRTKLRNNTIALINYELFLRDDFPEFEDSLKGILPESNEDLV
jgi:hypothetical protein